MPLPGARSLNRSRDGGFISKWIADYQPAIETAFIAILAALFLSKGVIPGWRSLNSDFPNYYVAARLIREHYCLDRIYDWIWFQRAADHFGVVHQEVGFLGLTPFSALPIVPLSWFPIMEAKRVWIVCNLVLLGASIQLLSKATGLSPRRAWLIGLCAVIPLRSSFLLGQMHILVLALMAAAYFYHMRGRQISSGACVALAAGLKIYPIFFCFYFLVKRRWKALGAAIVCTVVCLSMSYSIIGRTATQTYFLQQLPRSLQGESNSPFSTSGTSSAMLFHRLFLFEPELNPYPVVPSPMLYAVLYPLLQAILASVILSRLRTRFCADDREALEWAAFLSLLMVLSSNTATYQFVVLIAAAVPTFAIMVKSGRTKAAIVFALLYIAASNARTLEPSHRVFGMILPFLYLKLWAGAAMLLFYFIILKRNNGDESLNIRGMTAQPAFRVAVIMLVLWLLGGYSAWSHLKKMSANRSDYIALSDGAYLRSNPVFAHDGLSYVAMLHNGYRVLHGNVPVSGGGYLSAADELSFSTNASGSEMWIEMASDTGSKLVHLGSGFPDSTTCEIRDAESPRLSADGSTLSFLRDDHGHGSLWTADLRDCLSRGRIIQPARMTDLAYDVRTLGAGPSDTLLMSAIHQGRERIFVVSPGAQRLLLVGDDARMDSPAISSDGSLLVVRKLFKERWQLVIFNLASNRERQLTFGDCNAYTPAWQDAHTLLYATDCGRGLGLAALASLHVDP